MSINAISFGFIVSTSGLGVVIHLRVNTGQHQDHSSAALLSMINRQRGNTKFDRSRHTIHSNFTCRLLVDMTNIDELDAHFSR